MDKQISAYGINCGACKFLKQCGECYQSGSKVFYRSGEVCSIYNCASSKSGKM